MNRPKNMQNFGWKWEDSEHCIQDFTYWKIHDSITEWRYTLFGPHLATDTRSYYQRARAWLIVMTSPCSALRTYDSWSTKRQGTISVAPEKARDSLTNPCLINLTKRKQYKFWRRILGTGPRSYSRGINLVTPCFRKWYCSTDSQHMNVIWILKSTSPAG